MLYSPKGSEPVQTGVHLFEIKLLQTNTRFILQRNNLAGFEPTALEFNECEMTWKLGSGTDKAPDFLLELTLNFSDLFISIFGNLS